MCSNQVFVPKTLVHILVHHRSEYSLIHKLSPDVFCCFFCLFVMFLFVCYVFVSDEKLGRSRSEKIMPG